MLPGEIAIPAGFCQPFAIPRTLGRSAGAAALPPGASIGFIAPDLHLGLSKPVIQAAAAGNGHQS